MPRLSAVLLVLGVVCGVLASNGSTKHCESPLAPRAPKNWVAFLATAGGLVDRLSALRWTAPEAVLFEDGRLFWQDYNPRIRPSERWRESKVTPEEMEQFWKEVEEINPWTLPRGNIRHDSLEIADAGYVTMGIRKDGRTRSFESGDAGLASEPGASSELKTVARLETLFFEKLRRSESRKLIPDAIRVQALPLTNPRFSAAESNSVPWPLESKPPVFFYYAAQALPVFTGDQARQIIETIDRNEWVSYSGEYFRVGWAPAIDVPCDEAMVPPIRYRVLPRAQWGDRDWSSPDGRLIASEGEGEAVRIRRAKSVTPKPESEPKITGNMRVHWSPDGKWLTSHIVGPNVRLWYAKDATLKAELHGNRGYVHDLAWSADSERVAIVTDDGVRIWNTDGQLVRHLLEAERTADAVAWSPKSAQLSVLNRNGMVRLWNSHAWSVQDQIPPPREVSRSGHGVLAWSPDGKTLAVALEADMWWFNLDSLRAELITQGSYSTGLLRWRNDSKYLAAQTEGVVSVWRRSDPDHRLVLDMDFWAKDLVWGDGGRTLTASTIFSINTWRLPYSDKSMWWSRNEKL